MSKIKNRGITLVALVVTIVVLLILAGITIAQLTGNGLFEKAQLAAKETKYANAAEKVALAVNASYDTTGKINGDLLKENVNKIDGLDKKVDQVKFDLKIVVDGFEFTITEYGQITGEKTEVATLPENTKDTDAGTPVKLPSEWRTQTVSYIKTTDGTEVTTLETVATVYAVSDGNNNTIPVPDKFYYVGGTKDSGVVISDKEADKNKYAGQSDVPSGIEAVTDDNGNVTGISRTLIGNQFVWIPCSTSTYKKYDWGTTYRNNIYSSDVSAAEITQIQKYDGFYVGRYEAGIDSNISVATGTKTNGTENEPYDVSGTPRIQAGIEPWNFVSYTKSKANAESMYSASKSVNSGLLTGTMWDTMMYFMGDNSYTSSKLTSSTWGNYANTTPAITLGRYAKGYYSSAWRLDKYGSTWLQSTENTTVTKPVGTINTGTNGVGYVLTTGSSESCKLKNIYDVAGNLWEWTEETAITDNTAKTVLSTHRVSRGGSVLGSYSVNPACYRIYDTVSGTNFSVGFRVALYIK